MTQALQEDLNKKMETAQIGIEAEAFLNSPVGKYLQKRVKQEIVEAVNKLKTVDPCNSKEITTLQNDIYRAESFNVWLAELIITGREAEEEIKQVEGWHG
jgi:hypothetical protein